MIEFNDNISNEAQPTCGNPLLAAVASTTPTTKDKKNKKTFEGSKLVLDVCCGPKGMWFDKHDERALYLDRRCETHIDTYPCGTKTNIIAPDIIGDFTDIKQPDNSFWHIVFDPPHIEQMNDSQITKKYGSLQGDWREMLRKGFAECFRVLKPNGTLIFKWNDVKFPVKEILKLTDEKPLYGHKSGIKMQTHWICFIKS